MEFEFSSEQEMLRSEARRFLRDRCTTSALRAVMASPDKMDRDLWRGLADLGWLGVAVPTAYGGAGAGPLELCVLAGELGRALAPVPMLSSVYLATECLLLAADEAQKAEWLPPLVTGRRIASFAPWAAAPLAVTRDGLSGALSVVVDGGVADLAILAARTGDEPASLYLVDLTDPGITRRALATIDPSRGAAAFHFDRVPARRLGAPGNAAAVLEAVRDRAAVMLAFEQIGGADRVLEKTCDYARERTAFGRPIGSFQAVKHALVDMHVAATLARSNAYWAAWALVDGEVELPEAAAAARVSATEAFQRGAREGMQLHGGMGFTWEMDCHLYLRRSQFLALSMGSVSRWQDLLIERMCQRLSLQDRLREIAA